MSDSNENKPVEMQESTLNSFEPNLTMVSKENKFGVVNGEQAKPFGPSMDQMLPSNTGLTGGSPSLRQHGFAQPGQHIGAGLNYYTIYTSVDVTPTGIGQYQIPRGYPLGVYTDTVSNSQLMFDKLVETISLRAQPVVMSKVMKMATQANDTGTPGQAPSAGAPALPVFQPTPDFAPTAANGTYVWSFSFIIEHNGAWDTLQTGWMAEGHPPIKGGPTPYNLNPDLGMTMAENLMYMAPPFINNGPSNATTNTFAVVSQGPYS